MMRWLLLLAPLIGCERTEKASPPVAPPPARSAPLPMASPAPRAPRSQAPGELRLLTYNVLASPVFPNLRKKGIEEVITRADADVVALQEVVGWMVDDFVAARWADGLHFAERGGAPFVSGGQLVVSRHPITAVREVKLPGRQHRTALVVDLVVEGEPMAIATTHLESFLDDGPVRAKQLDAIFATLGDGDAVLLGDLNFGDGEEPETGRLPPGFVDVWTALRGDAPGYTWNEEVNPLAAIGAFTSEPSRRLDRILVRSDRWKPGAITIVGTEAVGRRPLSSTDRALIEPPDRRPADPGMPTIEVFPSDHFGLRAVLRRSP